MEFVLSLLLGMGLMAVWRRGRPPSPPPAVPTDDITRRIRRETQNFLNYTGDRQEGE